MLRLSRMADYGVVLLVQFVQDDARHASRSAAELAQVTGISLPTVSKCLKVLAKAGVLASQRGVKGGYRLSRPAEEISLAEAVQALDGPISLTICCRSDDGDSDGGECACELQRGCVAKVNWRKISRALEQALAGVSLAEMANPNAEMTSWSSAKALNQSNRVPL